MFSNARKVEIVEIIQEIYGFMKMPIKLSYALIAKSLFIAGVLTLAESHASQALTTFVSGLDHPNALAFDSNGNLYIANGNGDQVIESTGSGNSQPFATVPSLPNGLAFDNSGNLYVTDYSTNSVSKVTSNGSSYTQFATGFDQPYAIVFDSQNNDFYVSNFGNGTISQITSTGTNTITLPQGSQADAPSGLALIVMEIFIFLTLTTAKFTNSTPTATPTPRQH